MNIASKIDHTILSPFTSLTEVQRVCNEAIENNFASVCVPPYYVQDAALALKEIDTIKVCTVIGFPFGNNATSAKVEETKRAINDGANEVDMVVNINAVVNEDWKYVKNDIESITNSAHLGGAIVKIIIESSKLSNDQLVALCKICEEVNVDFVKTATGYNGNDVTVAEVSNLRSLLPDNIKIKASGGVKNKIDAQQLIDAGADRIGASQSLNLL